MYVLVAGAGEIGRFLVRLLRSEGHDVVLIESEVEAASRASNLDVMTVTGNAASPRVLERAGVAKADILYALTANDEANLTACSVARTRGVRTVARINSFEDMDTPVSDAFKPIGADTTVSIDMLGAIKLARVLGAPAYASVTAFAGGHLLLGEILVPRGSPVTNASLGEVKYTDGSAPLGFVRGSVIHPPTSNEALAPGDRLLLLVRRGVPLDRVAKPFLPIDADLPVPPRRILVAGATTMGIYLARLLAAEKAIVRVMDADVARVEKATFELSDVIVVRGSATDRAVLEEENIAGFDAFVAATGEEEFNIVAALIAKQLGVRRALAVVRQRELTDLAEAMGVDAAPSPRLDGLAALYRVVHPLEPDGLALLTRGDGQVLELVVKEGSRFVGRSARQLSLPKGAYVGAVYRAGETYFPGEEKEIREGDHLVLLARTDQIRELKRWL